MSQLATSGPLVPRQKSAKLAQGMKDSTKNWLRHILGVGLHLWVALSCLGLVWLGPVGESQGGWVSCPPRLVVVAGVNRGKERRAGGQLG